MSDLDPNRPGLEVWMADEQSSENGGIRSHFQDATDGTILWEDKGSGDNGRGCTGPLMPNIKGWQMWSGSGGLYDVSQKTVGSMPSSDNFTIWWGADLTRFLENGTSITPYSGGGAGLNASGCTSNNGSKSTPALTADIFGDWREELVLRTTGNDALRIYTTTTPTTQRLYTLMHDPIYRLSVATENVAYNQPPEPGIYIGPSMTLPQAQPKIKYYGAAPNPTGGTGGTTATGGAGGTTGSPGGTTGSLGGATGGSTGPKGGTTVTGGTTTASGGATGGSTGAKGGTTTAAGGATGGTVATTATKPLVGGTVAIDTSPLGGTTTASSTTATETGGIGGTVTPDTSPSGGTTTVASTTAAQTGGATGNGSTSPSGGTTTATTGETQAAGQAGCGCRLAGVDRSAAPWGVILVLGAMLATRLRRRGQRQRRS
jgi:hypothetical protein